MLFEWDEAKRAEVWKTRALDILHAARMFEGFVAESVDNRSYDEVRVRGIGEVEGEIYVLIYTRRDDVIRLITAWKAGRNARIQYQARKPLSN